MKNRTIALLLAFLMVFVFIGCSSHSTSEPTENAKPEAATTSEEEAPAAQETPAVQPAPEASRNPVDAEITESGYSLDGGYLFYSVKMHNPNEDYAVYLPSYRVTARDANGSILGTMDHTLSVIYPGQDFYYASQGFECDEEPASVDFDIIPGYDYNFSKPSSLDHDSFQPLEVVGANLKQGDYDKRILGEVKNNNDYAIEMAVVAVLFRDDAGNLVGGTCTFVNQVPAGGSVPFDINVYADIDTENYEVYANSWV